MSPQAEQRIQVGGHVSSSGGLYRAVERALEREMEAMQIFVSAPQTWRATNHSDEDCARFREAHAAAGLGEVWIHNIYLANLATETPEQLEKSVGSVVNAMRIAERIGAQGVVLHTGSHRGQGLEAVQDQVVGAITRILDEAPGEALLALETMAGQGGAIGTRFEEIGALIGAVGSPRLQACVDTAHSFAAGYAIHTADGLDEAMREFDAYIGLDRLAVVHANDSKIPLGGFRDRHENIGDGHIGTEGFEAIMAHPAFQGRAFLLEVPGIATEAKPKGDGPDAENAQRLKAIRDRVSGTGKGRKKAAAR
ncbi:MAG: deoxyribonuclease IV [Dehalococcoidia bacterium]|nr:deoxyribonuclease IV [Dehalococcoidia bacterium]